MTTSGVSRWCRHGLAAVTLTLLAVGCAGGGDRAESPVTNDDVPVADIADLPDIDATRAQMQGLIDQVNREIVRLVPATEPWTVNARESIQGCTQESSGRKGVTLYFAKLVSGHSLSDAEWDLVYPAVQRLAVDAGLTGGAEMQNSSSNHDVRFTSDDGRTLVFGSRAATLVSGSIACRRAAGGAS